jgi:hypothetical protein
MKEKIIEILINSLNEKMRGNTLGWWIKTEGSDAIVEFINQEVEKRIKERIPSDEETDKWADYCASNTTEDHDKRVVYKAALSLGALWFRSRLTEKPNNSKKGGEE